MPMNIVDEIQDRIIDFTARSGRPPSRLCLGCESLRDLEEALRYIPTVTTNADLRGAKLSIFEMEVFEVLAPTHIGVGD